MYIYSIKNKNMFLPTSAPHVQGHTFYCCISLKTPDWTMKDYVILKIEIECWYGVCT